MITKILNGQFKMCPEFPIWPGHITSLFVVVVVVLLFLCVCLVWV